MNAAKKISRNRIWGSEGFTIFEAFIVLTIITGITMMLIPYTKGWHATSQVNAVAYAVMSDLKVARNLSISKNHDVIVTFDIPENTYRIYLDTNGLGVDISNLVDSIPLSSIVPDVQFGYMYGNGVDGEEITAAVIMGNTSAPIRTVLRPNGSVVNPGQVYLIPTVDMMTATERQRAVVITSTGTVTRWAYDISGGVIPWKEYLYE